MHRASVGESPGAGESSHLPRDPAVVRRLVWNLPVAVYITDAAGTLLDANEAYLALVGVASLDELRRRVKTIWADPSQRATRARRLARDGEIRDFEFVLRRPDGSRRAVLDTCYRTDHPETGERLYCGALVDIDDRKRVEADLRNALIRDPLTGCYNRRYLADLEKNVDAGQDAVGAIVVDIDNFKQYNDEYGHQAGDEILVKLTRFLAVRVRPDDAVIRMGGDEFLVLLFGDDAGATADVAQRFAQSAAKAAPVPFSLGWVIRKPGEKLSGMIARADRELMHVRVQERRQRERRTGDQRDPGSA